MAENEKSLHGLGAFHAVIRPGNGSDKAWKIALKNLGYLGF